MGFHVAIPLGVITLGVIRLVLLRIALTSEIKQSTLVRAIRVFVCHSKMLIARELNRALRAKISIFKR